MARPPKEITLAQIVAAVDGPIVAGDFGEPHENGACEHEGQCVLLTVWSEVGQHMRSHLNSYTLSEMVDRARGTKSLKLDSSMEHTHSPITGEPNARPEVESA